MEDGPYRARRPAGGRRRALEDPEDVLARHGLLGVDPDVAPPDGRAARRHAAEAEPSPAYPVTSDGRHASDTPSERHSSARRHRADDASSDEPGRRRYRAEWDDEANGYRRHLPDAPFEADPWAGVTPVPTGGGRRRAPEKFDGPAADHLRPPPGLNGSTPRPDFLDSSAERPAGPSEMPGTGRRRRLADPPDVPAEPPADGRRRHEALDDLDLPVDHRRHRAEPIGPTGRRHRADDFDPEDRTWNERRRPSDTGERPRRRHLDPTDDPDPSYPGRRRDATEPAGPWTTDDPDTPVTRRRDRNPTEPRPDTGPPLTSPPPRGAGTGRRHIDPIDDPDLPARSHRRRTAEPDSATRRRHHEPTDGPELPATTSYRRRTAGPTDSGPLTPTGHRRRTAEPDSATRRRHHEPTDGPELPATTSYRRRTAEPTDPWLADPDAPPTRRRRDREPTELPADTRNRRTHPADIGTSATTALPALPASTGSPRRRLDPTDDAAGSIGPRRAARGPDERRRRPGRTDDDPDLPQVQSSATTALPAAGRRRPGNVPNPPDLATTALPTTRRPSPTDPPTTTALPAATGRRQRPEPVDHSGTRSGRNATSPEATVAVSATGPAPGQDDVEDPAPTTRVRRPADGDAADRDEDARTRALRIDETLTRMTAAHAGLTLAVTDRPAEQETSVPSPRRGAAATAGRLLAGALALMVLATAAFGWGTKTWLESAVRDAAALDTGSSAVVDAAAQSGDENVLVVAAEPAQDATPRADTVAVAHIPDGGGPVTVLAFPLDLEINRPPCERWDAGAMAYQDEPVQAEARTQLVTALDLGGPRCITRVVQQLSGLAITKYVGIDLGAVPAMTDAVGGAEVCVPRPVLDGVLGPVVPDAGMNQLAGVRAADYVHAADVEGDPTAEYGRIQRQQQVLAAVLDSAVSGTALLDIGRLAALRPTLSDAVLTDSAGIDEMLALAMTLRRLDADDVQYATVPTGEQNGRGNAVMRDIDASALFRAVRADEPLPSEATEPGSGPAGPAPSEVAVEVVNASARSGLAGEVSETLSSLGFDVGEPASADQPTSETVIRFSPDQAAAAELLGATVPSATSVPDPGSSGVLQLVLGRSFDDVVRAPSEPIALAAPAAPPTAEPAVTCT